MSIVDEYSIHYFAFGLPFMLDKICTVVETDLH
jgi:hypothetical protein